MQYLPAAPKIKTPCRTRLPGTIAGRDSGKTVVGNVFDAEQRQLKRITCARADLMRRSALCNESRRRDQRQKHQQTCAQPLHTERQLLSSACMSRRLYVRGFLVGASALLA